MQVLSRSKNQATDSVEPADMSHQAADPEKGAHTDASHDKATDQESLSSNAQAGVKAVEAAATVWTKYHLIGAYVMFVSSIHLHTSTNMYPASGGFTSSLPSKKSSFAP